MGCDEMTRRIQCRVISSVPLGKTADSPRRTNSVEDKPDIITDSIVDEAEFNQVGDSKNHTGSPNIPMDDDVIGRVLDCYV